MHGRKTPSAQNKIYSEITQSDKKVVLVCTPHFFVTLPNPDIVFIDEFESKHYYSIKPSFVSLVEFFKIYSKKTSTEILFCDNFIKSMADKNKSGVVDFVDMTDSSEATKHFWLSKTLGSKIKNTVLDKKNVVLYISRKGLSTQSICSDCRTPLTCSSCYTFLTLIKNGSSYSYSCNHCNTNKALESNDIVLCSKCSGFNFKTLGIGTQTVEKELLELGYRVFVYDKNNNDKVLSKNKTIESFYKTPGSVLIVNTLEPKILLKKTDFAAIVSMDSSLSIPFYDIDFYNLKTIKTLASISTSKIVVETRLRKNAFFDNIFSREDFFNLKDSISNDLKKLIYPPFSTVVEIVSYDDLSKTLDLESEVLEGKIKSFGRKVKNFYVYYIFFRNESWEKNSIKYLYRIKKISDRLKLRVHRF